MLGISVSVWGHSAEPAVHDKALRGFTKGRGNKNGTGGREGKGGQRQDSKGGKLLKREKGKGLLGVNMTRHCAALHRETKAGEMAGLGKRGNRDRDRDREGGRQNVKFWTQMKIASICRTGGRQR